MHSIIPTDLGIGDWNPTLRRSTCVGPLFTFDVARRGNPSSCVEISADFSIGTDFASANALALDSASVPLCVLSFLLT